MGKKRKTYSDDDGRVISNMNVDGMPWYVRLGDKRPEEQKDADFSDLTKEETWQIIKGTTLAALAVAGVFFLAFLVFILFCVYVWFPTY